MSLSVLIPVKRPEPHLKRVLERVRLIQASTPGLIREIFIEENGTLSEARKVLADKAFAHFALNLDADTVIPWAFPREALRILQGHSWVGAVALNYKPRPQSHPAFGCSVMPSHLMRGLYSWPGKKEADTCECIYMWRVLAEKGWILATLPMWAHHEKQGEHP